MKKRNVTLLKWLIPIALWLMGGLLLFAVPGYSFSALVLFGIGALISCYYLIAALKRKHITAGKVLNLSLTVLLCLGLLAAGVTEGQILSAAQGDPEAECAYMVVLGAGLHGSTPSKILSERIDAAYRYLASHPGVQCIVSGGQGQGEDLSEAQYMYNALTARGIDPARIWIEDQSTSTWENLQFTLALIEAQTGQRPEALGILSNEFHLYRAGLIAQQCGITPIGIPAETTYISLRINYFLREIAGVWHFWIFGD